MALCSASDRCVPPAKRFRIRYSAEILPNAAQTHYFRQVKLYVILFTFSNYPRDGCHLPFVPSRVCGWHERRTENRLKNRFSDGLCASAAPIHSNGASFIDFSIVFFTFAPSASLFHIAAVVCTHKCVCKTTK